MCEIRKFFQSFVNDEMIEVKDSPIQFEKVEDAYNYIHAKVRNFMEISQDMGTTEDGHVAKMPACFSIDETGKVIDFHHGKGRIDTRLVCSFNINPPSACLIYPH